MQFKDFHDFLSQKFMEDEPCCLDDDFPEAFDDWLEVLQPDDWIKYADEYKQL